MVLVSVVNLIGIGEDNQKAPALCACSPRFC
jgi:hypothetical protein